MQDGPEAAAVVRVDADQGLVRTPIIALTANAMVEQVESYLAAGMDGVAQKPIQPDALLNAIRMVLAQSQASQVPKAA